MIKSFRCKHTQALFEGGSPKRFRSFQERAERKLQMLSDATAVEDLRAPPGNRLEKLSGNRAGQWSIRITGQWRLCLEWHEGHAWNVEIVDYH
ncbi:MAG: type II toxin-antitoxin system RelE/ParE family toxin [Gammaproteobacteria bacterium]